MAFERSRAVLAKAGLSFPLEPGGNEPHIVDVLIAERGERIVAHPSWPLLRPFLHRVFRYADAMAMADALAPLGGLEGLEYLSRLLDLRVTVTGQTHVPASGGFVMVANHPTGIADGVAVFDALKPRRTDLAIFTNRDALRVNRRFADVMIPVEWRAEHKSTAKTRETLMLTNRAMQEGRAVIIFPSGRIAFRDNGVLTERPWQSSAVTLARRYGLPILPAQINASNSWLFYWLARWNTELRDMTVFNELLNKRASPFNIHFGPLIQPDMLQGDAAELTLALQEHSVGRLWERGAGRFAS